MLSYQHIYHAGNIVDCQKHAILSALFNVLNTDPAPYCYIDTHSGRGLYDLQSYEAQKIQDYKTGIEKIWKMKWPQEIRSYKDVLNKLNPDLDSHVYPGSPYIAKEHMREQDSAELYEIHPQEVRALYENMGHFDNMEVFDVDGWKALEEYIPPRENRGVVLVDPSYELKDDYIYMAERLEQALQAWPDGIFMVWYPILPAARHIDMLKAFKRSDIPRILKTEIYNNADPEKGLQGTGVLLINPPHGFDATVEKISKWLTISIGTREKTEWLSI